MIGNERRLQLGSMIDEHRAVAELAHRVGDNVRVNLMAFVQRMHAVLREPY